MKILQVFADSGAENPTMDNYGDVLRLSINIKPNQWSDAIQCDATQLPLKDSAQFDLGWFHPPCGGVSPMSDTGSGSRDDWPDLIPVARKIAEQHCDEWVIENKPRDSLNETVTLDGHMFNLGIEYKRAFECSFPVDQPPIQNRIAETSPFYYSERSHGWWAGVKGSSTEFTKAHLAKNTIPAAYIDYIMRHYCEHIADSNRPNYSDYDRKMETKRRKIANTNLEAYK